MPSTGDWWRPLCAFEKEPVPTIAVCGQESSRCHREGRLGEVWLAQSCNCMNPRAAETFRRRLELADNTLLFYFFVLQHSVLSVCPVRGVWLWHGQAIRAVVPISLCTGWSSVQLHHLQNPGCSESRVGLSFGSQCFQLCQLFAERQDEAGAPAFQWSIAGYFKEEEIKVWEVSWGAGGSKWSLVALM